MDKLEVDAAAAAVAVAVMTHPASQFSQYHFFMVRWRFLWFNFSKILAAGSC